MESIYLSRIPNYNEDIEIFTISTKVAKNKLGEILFFRYLIRLTFESII